MFNAILKRLICDWLLIQLKTMGSSVKSRVKHCLNNLNNFKFQQLDSGSNSGERKRSSWWVQPVQCPGSSPRFAHKVLCCFLFHSLFFFFPKKTTMCGWKNVTENRGGRSTLSLVYDTPRIYAKFSGGGGGGCRTKYKVIQWKAEVTLKVLQHLNSVMTNFHWRTQN